MDKRKLLVFIIFGLLLSVGYAQMVASQPLKHVEKQPVSSRPNETTITTSYVVKTTHEQPVTISHSENQVEPLDSIEEPSLRISDIPISSDDLDDPGFTDTPPNETVELGGIAKLQRWKISDANPDRYYILINDSETLVAPTTYASNTIIQPDFITSDVGIFKFTIYANDTFGNMANDSIFITVEDTTAPTVVSSPADVMIPEGSAPFFEWELSDIKPANYSIYLVTELVKDGDWSNGVNINYTLPGDLSPGIYNVELIGADTSGNTVSAVTQVTIVDYTSPIFEIMPVGGTIDYGTTGNTLTWEAADKNPNSYTISSNDTGVVSSGSWDNTTSMQASIDGLDLGAYNYSIEVTDASGNTITDWVVIVIRDISSPDLESISPPTDLVIDEEDDGLYTLTWTPVDHFPGTYNVTRNGAFVALNGQWSSGIGVTQIIDPLLPFGQYEYIFYAVDQYGNLATSSVNVEIIDKTLPSITSPGNVSISEGTTGNSITWSAFDRHASSYVLYLNDEVWREGSWTGGGVSFSLDSLVLSENNLTIEFIDLSDNVANDTIFAFVLDVPIFFSQPSSIQITNQTVGQSISWTVKDSNADYFNITKNGVLETDGTWANGVPISVNVDESETGSYLYEIWLNDTDNNFIQDTVYVNVTDVPYFGDITYSTVIEEGSSGNQIVFSASDDLPGSYSIYSNITGSTTIYEQGTWSSGASVPIDIDGLLKGIYVFTIEVGDTSGNLNSTDVSIEVLDNIDPNVEEGTPSTIEYNDGTTGHSISWTVIENNPENFLIYRDDVEVDSGPYENNSVIAINIDGLDIGSYIYTLALFDTSGNPFNSTVTVTVNDVEKPEITPGPDQTGVEGSPELDITFTIIDENPTNYTVYRNSTGPDADIELVTTGYLSNQLLVFDVSQLSLPVGVYNFTIVARDISGNTAWVQINVEITDVPVVTATPTSDEFDDADSSKILNWIVEDSKPGSYTVSYFPVGTSSVTQLPDAGWESGQAEQIDVSGFTVGEYNITIIFSDTTGNSVTSSIILTIVDSTAPVVDNQPQPEISINEGTTGNTLTWTASDNYPGRYVVYIGEDIASNSTWEDGEPFGISIDGLATGTYAINITVSDSSGNPVTGSYTLQVFDVTIPTLNQPGNITMIEGTSDNAIVWVSTERHPDYYELYLDGDVVSTESWESGNQIIIDLDTLTKGSYNYTIILYDESGNSNSDHLTVTVVDGTNPEILVFSLEGSNYIEGTQGNNLQLIASDNYEGNYTILLDSEIYSTSSWTSDERQFVDIDGFAKGTYNFTITLYDASGNLATQSVFVDVLDQTLPVITSDPGTSVTMEELAESKVLLWNVSDLYPGTYMIYINGSLETSGNWQNGVSITGDVSDLLLGAYSIVIDIMDESNNTVSFEVTLTVIDATAPQLLSSPGSQVTVITGTTGNTISWVFSDNHPESFFAELDGQPIDQGTWNNDDAIVITLDGLSFGIYNITVYIKDTSNNQATSSITVRVDDPAITRTLVPSVSSRPNANEGDLEFFSGVWRDETGTAVTTGSVELVLYSSGVVQSNYSLGFENGRWNIYLNYSSLNPGIYTWHITFESPGYQSQTVKHEVRVHPNKIDVSFIFSGEEVVQGSNFVILVSVTYLTSNNSVFALDQEAGNFTRRQGGVAGIEVLVTIEYIHANGDQQLLERTFTSDSEGKGLITLTGEVTRNIRRIRGVSASFGGSSFLEPFQNSRGNLEIESVPPPPDRVELAYILLSEFIELVILVALLIASGIFAFRYYDNKRRKRISKILEDVSDAHDEIISMMGIRTIILQNHGGIPIYIEESGKLGVEGVLISGFSRAISTFLDEIEESTIKGFESIQRDTFAINSFASSRGRVIFLSSSTVPEIIKSRMIEIMTASERFFGKELEYGISLEVPQFREMVSQTNLKYTLLQRFTLNRRAISNALRLRSLNRVIKENFEFLLDLPREKTSSMKLEDLYKELRANLIPPTMVSKIISVGYSLDAFVPASTD